MIIGFIQNKPEFGEVAANLKRLDQILEDQTADLMILPELFATGYQFKDLEEARHFSEPIPDGETCVHLHTLAKTKNMCFIAGLAEREGEVLYNSAVAIGPEGLIGSYRKAHVFDTEKRFFKPGNVPLPVFDILGVKVGIMICFDWRFPETTRTLALKGAEIIAHPSNLVLPHCPQAMITRCLENRVFAVTADRVGRENRILEEPLEFIGQSQIVDPDGNVLYRASQDQEEVHVIEIDINKARNKKINPVNDLIADRRKDLYELN